MRKKSHDGSVRAKPDVVTIVVFVVLALYTVFLVFPMLWALLSSVKNDYDFMHDPFGLPTEWMFSNFWTALNEFRIPVQSGQYVFFSEMLLNSLIYALGCAVINTTVVCVVAYVTSKYRFRFSKVVYGIVIVTMILPVVGSLPSQIRMARVLGLYDSFIGMFVMKANFLGMNYLIFYSAFKNLPWDYAEAAFVDGASHFRAMVRIMIPMIKPVILVCFVLSFIGYWNDYYDPMIFMPNHPTAAYGLYAFQNSSQSSISTIPMKIAGCVILFIPIFILFLFMKNKLIGNLTIGGLKG